MGIEICGCYHNGQIWSPCDNHRESIIKNAELTGGTWWMDTTSGGGPEGSGWPDEFLNNFTGPRRVLGNTNPLLEHNIDKDEFWFMDEDVLHKLAHAPTHTHDKINYEFNDDERSQLGSIKERLNSGDLPAHKAGEAAGLMIAQAQSRIVPDWSVGLHLLLKHDLPATGMKFDGHFHTEDIPEDKLAGHLDFGHMDDSAIAPDLRHKVYHQSFGHFLHNKLSGLYAPDHGHDMM